MPDNFPIEVLVLSKEQWTILQETDMFLHLVRYSTTIAQSEKACLSGYRAVIILIHEYNLNPDTMVLLQVIDLQNIHFDTPRNKPPRVNRAHDQLHPMTQKLLVRALEKHHSPLPLTVQELAAAALDPRSCRKLGALC